MAMHPAVEKHLDEIRAAAERYGVEKLEIFGSAMTPEFDVDRSDVDFIVHYPPGYDFGVYLSRYLEFEEELGEILERPVQLVMTSALRRDSFRRNAEATRTPIYATSRSDSGATGHQAVLTNHS